MIRGFDSRPDRAGKDDAAVVEEEEKEDDERDDDRMEVDCDCECGDSESLWCSPDVAVVPGRLASKPTPAPNAPPPSISAMSAPSLLSSRLGLDAVPGLPSPSKLDEDDVVSMPA